MISAGLLFPSCRSAAAAGIPTAPGKPGSLSLWTAPIRHVLRRGRVALLALLFGCLPLSSLAAVQLAGISCPQATVSGAARESCTVTMSGYSRWGREVYLSSSSSAVTVPSSIDARSTSDSFTARIAAVSSPRYVTLTAASGGVSKTYTLHLLPAGTSGTPGLTLSASSLNFGNVTLNTGSTQTVTLSSSGTAALLINSLSLSGAGFTTSSMSLPLTLNPGQTASLQVTFDPTVAGAAAGLISIATNASSAATTVALSGTGVTPAPTAALSALSCASGSLQGSATDACTVSLTAAAPSGGLAVALSSSNSSVKVPASVTVASGSTTAAFSATASAVTTAQSATLTAAAGSVTKTFSLQLIPLTPALTLGATSLSFGTVNLNAALVKTVTLTSSGTGPLTISGATVAGAGFAISGLSFPLTLNAGQSATLSVQFDPTTAGAVTGSVTVSSNASSNSTATITLSGTGQAAAGVLSGISCSSSSLTGATTDACSVSLTAGAGSGGLVVTLSSSSSAVKVPSSVTVAANSTTAAFSATASAVTSAQTATLTATAGGVTKTYTLQLAAATPSLTLGSTSVAFGSVTLNTPATQTVTMTASGTAPVTVSAAAVSGTGFSASGTALPVTLNPGQSASLNLQFDPKTAGASTGSVALTSNCSMGAMTIALSGTGQAPASATVDLSWNAPVSSPDPVAGYNVYRATGSGGFQRLNPAVVPVLSYTDTTAQSGATYKYEVTSVDASGVESVPSNVFTATIP